MPAGPGTDLARLVIPRIAVNAAVEDVGLDNSGSMGVPLSSADVGWFSPGPWPGQDGDAVIDGHLDWRGIPAVFWNLGALKPGDTISVSRKDQSLTFRVTRVTAYALNEEPAYLFASAGTPLLSLITCAGAWDSDHQIYDQRLVVDAMLV
ncbi:MAG: class F sortase [Candidatus Dormibacteria bacterium]